MQYYHFRSIRKVSLQILRTVTIQTKGDRRPYYEVFLPDRFIIRYESKFLACCFAFFKWARLRRAGDKRDGVSRSTPASFSMKHAKVLQTSKFLIIYTTPVVHWPAWLSDQSEFWCLLHLPMRNGERRRKLERKGVPNIKLFLRSFFFCCCCLFCFCLFVFFPVSINSPRSLCKRLSFPLKTEPVSKAASTHIQILLKTWIFLPFNNVCIHTLCIQMVCFTLYFSLQHKNSKTMQP